MKVDTYTYPKSSFLGMPKDMAIIMDKILGNQTVLKLLRYNDSEVASKPDVTSKDIRDMFTSKQITNTPRLQIPDDGTKRTYLRVYFTSVTQNNNSFYRDSMLEIRIICHFDNWNLQDYDTRPFRIAGELDSMLDQSRLTGIGILQLVNADQDVYDEDYGGWTLKYWVVRGHEDDINPL